MINWILAQEAQGNDPMKWVLLGFGALIAFFGLVVLPWWLRWDHKRRVRKAFAEKTSPTTTETTP